MADMIPFDYSALSKDTRGKLRWFTSEIKKLGEARTKSGMEIGRMLAEAKAMLDDDTCFAEWVQREFGISKSSAYNAIAAHRNFGDFPSSWKIEDSAMAVLATNLDATKTAKKMASQGAFITKKIAVQLVAKNKPSTPRLPAAEIVDAEFEVVESASEAVESTKADSPKDEPPTPPKPPATEKDYGTCPNCAGTKWTTDDDGTACSRCLHPHGEPVGDRDEDDGPLKTQRSKTAKTAEALLRAFDDLHLMVVRPSEHAKAIACCKSLVKIAKEWQ